MSAPEQSGDVVFLAEMCERNGPVVVLSHPPSAHVPADLAVRLFSCDVFGLQGNVDGSEYVLQRDAFCILRLSPQIPQQQPQQQPSPQPAATASAVQGIPQPQPPPPKDDNPYIAAHHFQMCEMSGRGLIRKVCVAFVTNDHHKLFQNMNVVSSVLSAAAACVCDGNLASFISDVSCIIEELRSFNDPSNLDRHCKDIDYTALKDAHPSLLQQYERLHSQPFFKTESGFKTDSGASPTRDARQSSDAISRTIPHIPPFERLRTLHRFGRPIESFRPLLSTFTPGRRRLVNDSLRHAQAVCSQPPEVLWALAHESRFMSPGEITGHTTHTDICGASMCSPSAFLKPRNASAVAPDPSLASSERPQLHFGLDDSLSVLLRHHILSQAASDAAPQRPPLSTDPAAAASKSTLAKSDVFGLKETRVFLTDSLFKNVVFALLKGENVIIRGKPDDRATISSMVRALSVFIPQNVFYVGTKSNEPPAPFHYEWLDATLDICDLGSVKLAGGPMSLDAHERAKNYVSKISVGDKSVTAVIPRYRADERSGLVSALVGKASLVDKWSNDVLMAHIRMEIASLGRLIMQWLVQHGVAHGRAMLSTKSRDIADALSTVLGHDDGADLPKMSRAKSHGQKSMDTDVKVDKAVRPAAARRSTCSHVWLFCSAHSVFQARPTLKQTQSLVRPTSTLSQTMARSTATLSQMSITADAPKSERPIELSDDDLELVQVSLA
jgi:hypothetical protein